MNRIKSTRSLMQTALALVVLALAAGPSFAVELAAVEDGVDRSRRYESSHVGFYPGKSGSELQLRDGKSIGPMGRRSAGCGRRRSQPDHQSEKLPE